MTHSSLSAVIPTRNRPDDLVKAVASVLAQTRLPEECLIIDQSPGNESQVKVESMLAEHARQQAERGQRAMRLIYVHDQSIPGLVAAKHDAVGRASGNLICFLEDDLVLEPEYLANMERGFSEHPDMVGSCGVMTNVPRMPFGYASIYKFFHRGIFIDERIGVFYSERSTNDHLIPCITLCGGISAWRREVFALVPFDIVNGFHMMEDIDFSTRVAMQYGPRLFINPSARTAHNFSPINRDKRGDAYRRKVVEAVIFFKKRRSLPWALVHFLWLLVGLSIEALFKSIAHRSFYPIRGLCGGLFAGLRKQVVPQPLGPARATPAISAGAKP